MWLICAQPPGDNGVKKYLWHSGKEKITASCLKMWRSRYWLPTKWSKMQSDGFCTAKVHHHTWTDKGRRLRHYFPFYKLKWHWIICFPQSVWKILMKKFGGGGQYTGLLSNSFTCFLGITQMLEMWFNSERFIAIPHADLWVCLKKMLNFETLGMSRQHWISRSHRTWKQCCEFFDLNVRVSKWFFF